MLDIRIGAAQTHELLTVFPLLASGEPELPYALLSDAIGAGSVRIGEVGQGSVPALLADNGGDLDVLVLDGEQLIGSKQNRMTNRSILLPAHGKVEIPVSCMEHGRWRYESDVMRAAPQHSPSKVRKHARIVEASYARAGSAAPAEVLREAQGSVWSTIADTTARLGGASDTGAMDRIYDANAARLEEMERAFTPAEHQLGLLAFAGDDARAAIGLDVVGGRTLYARLHHRLLRGYLLDALDCAAERGGAPVQATSPATAQAYLDSVRTAARVPAPTVGKGAYAVLTGALVGGELLDDERVAHLSAFPADEHPDDGGHGGLYEQWRVARPSQRRRNPPIY